MARRSAEDETSDTDKTNRRAFMKTVGLAATAAAGTAVVGSRGSAATTVDLADKGLANGDNIDSYLSEYFEAGNEVHVPAGEYEYTGDGIGGDKSNCALVGSPEGVTFKRPSTDTVIRPTLWAGSGKVRIENITVKGKRGQEQSRWRVGAASGATVEVVNVNMPDGTVDGSDSTGIYAGTDHAGTLKIRHCYFSDFGNVACYVSDPYVESNGKVVVEDCDFVNTGMSALRLAPDNSEVRRCYFESTEKAASSHVGWNQRGIKIDDAGKDVVVEDCDFLWDDPGRTAIKFDDKGEGGEGVMRNLRIQNEGSNATFAQDWSVGDNWTGENIHLTGSGTHNAPGSFQTVTGSEAESPNTDYEIWTPQNGDGGSGGSGSATETATESEPDRITINGSTTVPAETGIVGGDTSVRTVHDGYNGDGFVDLEPPSGGTIEWPLKVDSAGIYDVVITHSQGGSQPRTADLVVNGETSQITMDPTGSWSTWETMTVTMMLEEGKNDVRVETTGEDTGHIDTLEFIPVEIETETETSPDNGTGSEFERILIDGQTAIQAEQGTLGGDSSVRTVHQGYNGSGFVDPEPPSGGSVSWPLQVTKDGSYDIAFRYSSGDTANRTADIVVNGERREITFEPTGGWSTWETMTTAVTLTEGENEIRIVATGEDTGHLDILEFIPRESGPTETPTEDGSDSTDDVNTETPTDDNDTSDGNSSDDTTSFDKVLAIDGTGDAEETARYTFTVSGDVEWNEERSEVRDGGIAWDNLNDSIGESRVVGIVGNGVDAYNFSGSITEIDIRGKASFTIIRS